MTKSMFVPVAIGNPRFTRYGISDNRKPYSKTRYWTGKKAKPWSTNAHKAMVWADFPAVMAAIQDIGRTEFRHLPERKMTLTIDVAVLGDATREEVIEYLMKSMSLQMDYNTQGMGPDGSLVFVNVTTDDLKETA